MSLITRSQTFPAGNPKSDLSYQNLFPSYEPCSFDDSDIEVVRTSFFPKDTVFRPFEPNVRPDIVSDKWVCFSEYPFKFLQLSFPFPKPFTDFFRLTNMSYVQAMPMIWRVLYIVLCLSEAGIDISIHDLAHQYQLRTHGSGYFLLKVKPGLPKIFLDVTQNDSGWKKRFFFVSRESLPSGLSFPSRWITKANLDHLIPPLKGVEDRLENLSKLSNTVRSFACLIQGEAAGSQENSLVMSKKSSAHFSLSDLEGDSPVKKVVDPPKPRALPLRSKTSSKRKKVDEVIEIPEFPVFLDFHDAVKHGNMVIEQMVKSYEDKVQALEELDHQIMAKDLVIKKELEKSTLLRKEMEEKDASHFKEMEDVIAEAKNSVLIAVYEARIKMAEEVTTEGFDVSSWKVDCWKKNLAQLKGEDPEGAIVEFKKDGVAPSNEGQDERA